MKQLRVNNKCSGCGLCVMNCTYLRENEDGNAEVIPGKAIAEQDIKTIQKIVQDCPEGALEIISTGSTAGTGIAGAQAVVRKLDRELKAIEVSEVESSKLDFNVDDFDIPIPRGSIEYRRYSSKSAAKSAAREEFRRLCYSETAYRPVLKKIFVEYKVKRLRPYYTCTDTADSIYYSLGVLNLDVLLGSLRVTDELALSDAAHVRGLTGYGNFLGAVPDLNGSVVGAAVLGRFRLGNYITVQVIGSARNIIGTRQNDSANLTYL